MRVVVTGGAGVLGRVLVSNLSSRDHDIVVITRSKARATALTMMPRVFLEDGDVTRGGPWQGAIARADAVIHLAAPSIFDAHASPGQDAAMLAMRLRGLKEIVGAVQQAPTPPRVLLLASSVAIYGERADVVDERATLGSGVLAELFRAVEEAAAVLRPRTRIIALRLGQLLAPGSPLTSVTSAAALPDPTTAPFSFIHVGDAANFATRAMTSSHDGPLNVVATPTTLAGLHKALALTPAPSGLGRLFKKAPAVTPVTVLSGQGARSRFAESLDFYPSCPTIDAAIKACRPR